MKYRAALYRNEGQAVRILLAYSEICESPATAMQFAEDMKLDNPAPEYWVAVVSEKTAPHNFP